MNFLLILGTLFSQPWEEFDFHDSLQVHCGAFKCKSLPSSARSLPNTARGRGDAEAPAREMISSGGACNRRAFLTSAVEMETNENKVQQCVASVRL